MQLNLSPTTVSRALAGYADVSAATRERAVAAARLSGYVPSAAARRMVTGRMNAVGFVLPVAPGQFADPFLFELLIGIGGGLSTRGFDLVVAAEDPASGELEAYERLAQGDRIDGIVLCRTRVTDDRIAFLRRTGLPFVSHGRWDGPLDFDHVDCDNHQGGVLAAEFLLGLGHRDLVMINAPREFTFARDREAGFRGVARERGVAVSVHEASSSCEETGADAMRAVLRAPSASPGIFCATDRLALGALDAAREAGLEAGSDLSVVGFDDLPLSRYAAPQLTTFRQPTREAGRRLAELLLHRIGDPVRPPVADIRMPELVLRQSHVRPRAQ